MRTVDFHADPDSMMMGAVTVHLACSLLFFATNGVPGLAEIVIAAILFVLALIIQRLGNRSKLKSYIPYLYLSNLMVFSLLIWEITRSMAAIVAHAALVMMLSVVYFQPRYIWFTSFAYFAGMLWTYIRHVAVVVNSGQFSVILLPLALALVLHHVCRTYHRTMQQIREAEQLDNLKKLEQQQHLAIIGQVAASIAHDIRNPLTSIKGFVQLIAKNEPRSSYQEYYRIIGSEITRIDTLLKEVLMLAKSHTVSTQDNAVVNLMEMLNRLAILLEPDAIKCNIQIELQGDGGLCVQGAEEKLQQVFLNLLRNAFEAIRSDGKIEIVLSGRQGQAEVRIRDTGPGIPKELLPKLFTPFFTTKTEGTGLGLPICKTIVEVYGGTIEARNLPGGRGAEFVVRIPQAPADVVTLAQSAQSE